MKEVTLTINDREVRCKESARILEVARSIGIEIPTLCHHEKLTDYGVCRLCTVEITKKQRSHLVASCVYPVEDGLIVKTDSQRVIRGRRILLELMLARWYLDTVGLNQWPWKGNALLEHYGLEQSRFEEDITQCILCGLCVRYCSEVKKANVLGFIGRGIKRQVILYPELAVEVCPTCDDGKMECRSVCPTGVIPNDFTFSGPRFGRKLPLAMPVRAYDRNNIQDILKDVGDL